MTTRIEIKCINKDDRFSPHERIQAVGGDGWKWPLDKAIQAALSKAVSFFVTQNGRQVAVDVAYHLGRPYLKTVPDSVFDNNLLYLPECRWN